MEAGDGAKFYWDLARATGSSLWQMVTGSVSIGQVSLT